MPPGPIFAAKPPGNINAKPIKAAPNNIFPKPRPAPLITGTK